MHAKTAKSNRLIGEASPYLLQHAHNPVEWYPWGNEALERAKAEQKLVLVSLGYSTCYWCHVMEREVFEEEAIAEIMNANFICIKIDREERPDLDHYFMAVTQLLNQQGGWPNNVFLTPELQPVFAGTYFGPSDTGGRIGFPTLLKKLQEVWSGDKHQVLSSGKRIERQLHAYLNRSRDENAVPPQHLPFQVQDSLLRMEDEVHGGFYNGPKFPHETYLLFLLHREESREIALRALDAMAAGGIHDLVGGGFHRYAVDAQWRVPHFEKMLYNQALFLECYAKTYQATRKPEYKLVVDRLAAFVARELTSPDGAFYSALDAETDGVEGAYYTWRREEIPAKFSLEPLPHFSGHKPPEGDSIYLKEIALLPEAIAELDALHAKRIARKYPRRDEKIIASWNGLMIHALAVAGYTIQAEQAAEACWKLLYTGTLCRIYAGGKTYIEGQFEDYAFLFQGLVSLYKATQMPVWKERSALLQGAIERLFFDRGKSCYYSTAENTDLPIRLLMYEEGALPSALSVYANACLDNGDRDNALKALKAGGGAAAEFPLSHVHLLLAWQRYNEQQSNVHPLLATLVDGSPQACGEEGCSV